MALARAHPFDPDALAAMKRPLHSRATIEDASSILGTLRPLTARIPLPSKQKTIPGGVPKKGKEIPRRDQ